MILDQEEAIPQGFALEHTTLRESATERESRAAIGARTRIGNTLALLWGARCTHFSSAVFLDPG